MLLKKQQNSTKLTGENMNETIQNRPAGFTYSTTRYKCRYTDNGPYDFKLINSCQDPHFYYFNTKTSDV